MIFVIFQEGNNMEMHYLDYGCIKAGIKLIIFIVSFILNSMVTHDYHKLFYKKGLTAL